MKAKRVTKKKDVKQVTRLLLIAEFKGELTDDEAQDKLDAFREAVGPAQGYGLRAGLTLFRATAETLEAFGPLGKDSYMPRVVVPDEG